MKRKPLVSNPPPQEAVVDPKPVEVPHLPTPLPSSPEAMDMGKITEAFSQQLQIEDIDVADSDNPQLCAEYAKDIYKYMKELEVSSLLCPIHSLCEISNICNMYMCVMCYC